MKLTTDELRRMIMEEIAAELGEEPEDSSELRMFSKKAGGMQRHAFGPASVKLIKSAMKSKKSKEILDELMSLKNSNNEMEIIVQELEKEARSLGQRPTSGKDSVQGDELQILFLVMAAIKGIMT
jgi:hypothetical protein